MNWLRRFFPTRVARETLLNDGLALAMDWGDQWLAPIQERLARQHPTLEPHELDELNDACQAAMRFGHETAYRLVAPGGTELDASAFAVAVRERFPWIDAANGERLLRQSLYYLWKAGGPPRDAAPR